MRCFVGSVNCVFPQVCNNSESLRCEVTLLEYVLRTCDSLLERSYFIVNGRRLGGNKVY